ncbi:MAG: hypothetical protein ACRDL7_00125 [Gaiellaceae bacterium]
MSEQDYEQQAEVSAPIMHDPNAVLIDLQNEGDYVDCIIHDMEEPRGRMNSPMLHGVSTPDNMPFKMWANSFLKNFFTKRPELIGKKLRIRRMVDEDVGQESKMKTYRISDLKLLLSLIEKDKPSPVKSSG